MCEFVEVRDKIVFIILFNTNRLNYRSELVSARTDRDAAKNIQGVLQQELDDSRAEKKKLKAATDRDAKVIQDLQRSTKEMERILARKHPDSVSALIVANKSSSSNNDNSSIRKVLEKRIAQLEDDAKQQDVTAKNILASVQSRFNSVQGKYEAHIEDLETQVLSLQVRIKDNFTYSFKLIYFIFRKSTPN